MAEKLSKKELKEMRRLEEMRRANLERHASTTKWIAIGAVSTIFLGLFIFLVVSMRGSNPNIGGTESGVVHEFSDSGEYRLAANSTTPPEERPVIMTEFVDMQCGACQQYHPIVKNVLDLYPETVALYFKHFPISSIHQNAVPAAVAVEAAGRQGKFHEMTDLLFERQQAWARLPNPRDQFISYAEELELDIDQFTADLDDRSLEDKIEQQRTEGIRAGVTGTPSFFINGVRIQNPSDISGFQAAIDAALAESGASTQAPELTEEEPLLRNEEEEEIVDLDL